MGFSIWDYGDIVSRWLIYMGVSAAIGGPFIAVLIRSFANIQSIIRYIQWCLALGIVAVIANFFFHVGGQSQSGFSGMFASEVINNLWHTGLGDSVLWRLFGFSAIAALFLLHLRRRDSARKSNKTLFLLCYLTGLLALSYSFTLLGNTAGMGTGASYLMAIHIITSAWWLGALYPLLLCYRLLEQNTLYQMMRFFGQITLLVVPLMLVCGGVLLMQILASPSDLFTTQYGQIMLLKLITVISVILLVTLHKLKIVPVFMQMPILIHQKHSIISEMFLADIILVITAVLSGNLVPVTLS